VAVEDPHHLAPAAIDLLLRAVVFGTVLVVGAGCIWFGIRQLSVENLMPNKTIAQVQKDFESITPETN